jgi:hypothetical protein
MSLREAQSGTTQRGVGLDHVDVLVHVGLVIERESSKREIASVCSAA